MTKRAWLSGPETLRANDHGDRQGFEPETVVIHYTANEDGRALARWAASEKIGRSWHFLICRDGKTIQQVPLNREAWHVGVGEAYYRGEMTSDPNRFTIGIELANLGLVQRNEKGAFVYEAAGRVRSYPRGFLEPVWAELIYDSGHRVAGWWEPYPKEQLDALRRLLVELVSVGYDCALVGHEEIAMPLGRKTDPGPLFPWGEFGRAFGRRTNRGSDA